jgi:DegV family protein with EDD domain
MSVAVVSDSAADLPAAWCEAQRVAVVPLTVRIAGVDHLDGVDLTASEFWAACRQGGDEVPRTAAPSPAAFAAAFQRAGEAGASAVVCVTLAAGLSSTFQSALLAAREAPLPVEVVDSGSASAGQAFVVRAAVGARGGGPGAVLAAATETAHGVRLLGALADLTHLRRSGRLSGAKALVGSVLAVAPVVELADGGVSLAGRQRTLARAVDALANLVERAAPQEVAVVHGDADPAMVDRLVGRLHAAWPDPPVQLLGPVVGAHLGPGTVGVAFRRAARPDGAPAPAGGR